MLLVNGLISCIQRNPKKGIESNPERLAYEDFAINVAFKEIPKRELRDGSVIRWRPSSGLLGMVAFKEIPKRELRVYAVHVFCAFHGI
jgi:hypothetical protein